MQSAITIITAEPEYKEAIIALLEPERLPVEDLPYDLPNFFIALDSGNVIGTIRLEVYGGDGLLRSLVVKPEYRKLKIAEGLVNEIERLGSTLGLENIYLLTETAQGYFAGKGYQLIERKEAPQLLQQSSEFSHACPASAILMKKNL